MNYSQSDLPNSGESPIIYFDISLGQELLGRIYIKLYRDVFPAGVENFVKISDGKTHQIKKMNTIFNCLKSTNRSYKDCKFFKMIHGNYIVCGDVYNNNGTTAGTIYNDEPIPGIFGDYYYPHTVKGLVSLVPYVDEVTGNTYYDSTFIITLDDVKPNNILSDLDEDHIVIGEIYQGLDIIDKINKIIIPYAGRRYPNITISDSGISNTARSSSHKKVTTRTDISIDNHRRRINLH